MSNKSFPTLCNDKICTGCSACSNVCPVDAIQMVPNCEGFLNPTIDKGKCIKCLKCSNVCPVINHRTKSYNDINVYACWNINNDIRKESSSGGVFSALAKPILENGGYVIGAAYNDKMALEHISITRAQDIYKIRGSKYIQSNIKYIYREIKSLLDCGNKVMFVGSPCQVAGLKNYIGINNNLVCCDFICHGVPSQTLFTKYIKWIEDHKKVKISNYNFRDKSKGWYDASRTINNNIKLKGKYDIFFYWFNQNITLRESCYKCPAIGMNRHGDITIADYWGIGMEYKFDHLNEINKGVSFVMINNHNGALAFEEAKKFIQYEKRPIQEILYRNKPLIYPSKRPQARDSFYIDMNNIKDFEELRKKYKPKISKTLLIYRIKEHTPYLILSIIRNVSQIIIWKKNGSKTI